MNKKVVIIISSIIALAAIIGLVFFFTKDKKVNTYNVSFETNGGTTISTQVVNEGDNAIKPNDPTKEGYMFVQWLYEGKTYDFSSEVKTDLVLKAEWIEKVENIETFVVSFDSEGGTTIPNQIIERGNKIIIPINPTKEGYTFVEWQLNGVKYDFESVVESDIELFAKWEQTEIKKSENSVSNNNQTNNNKPTPQPSKKEYTVNFDSTGGSNVSSQKVVEGNKVTNPSNPSKTNYLFNGWFLGDKEYDFNYQITSNITLTANWVLYGDVNEDGNINTTDIAYISKYISGKMELNNIQLLVADVNIDGLINTIDTDILAKYIADKEGYGIQNLPYNTGKQYQINYELNGGEVKQQNISIYAEISLEYELKNPTKEGYVFAGWTGSNGVTPQKEVIIPEGTTGNLSYVANWVLYGDVNEDGNINTTDIAYISKYISGKMELNNIQLLVADVNIDGLINTTDTDILAKYIADKVGYGIPKLPHTS